MLLILISMLMSKFKLDKTATLFSMLMLNLEVNNAFSGSMQLFLLILVMLLLNLILIFKVDDAFSGSMQLLAGVKLCTGRTLTNHPHFEDKALRDRTKELYQMYGKVCVGGCFEVDA